MNAPPQLYAARCGRRCVFMSAGDRDAYEAGYDRFPAACTAFRGTPEAQGWSDAMAEEDHRAEDREDARAEAEELMGDW